MTLVLQNGERESSLEEDSDEKESMPNTKLAFPDDTHASFMLALGRWWDSQLGETEGVVNLAAMTFTTFFLHALTLFLQIYISVLMYVFVIERREDPFESHLNFRADLLQAAVATNTPIDTTDRSASETLTICWKDHSVRWSMSILLFIWFAKVSIEIKAAAWATWISYKLPNTETGYVVTRDKVSGELLIKHLTPSLRCIFLVLVNLPRVIVCVITALIGAKFLEFATSVGVLIMKSVGLAFIAALSTMLHQSLTPGHFKAMQKKTFFHYYSTGASGNWMLFGSLITAVQVTTCAVCAFVTSRVFFHDVQSFRHVCNAYEEKFHEVPIYETFWKVSNCTLCGYKVFGYTFSP